MTKFITLLLTVFTTITFAQTAAVNPRPITAAEYQKAKTFSIKDLDNETYVKFENIYILDRYEARKPYFITGDDGLKKRIDLYKLIAKENMQELGLFIFYTNETGKQYNICMPNFTADTKVWEQYFNDIDAINKEEKNYILKLSYVLSKEMGFQLYKSINQGKDISKESATYGNDICFPGDQLVRMANNSQKLLKDIKSGDEVITIDPQTQLAAAVKVKELTVHEARNYAITQLTLIHSEETESADALSVKLSGKILEATPNHPMKTENGERNIGEIKEGEKILCLDEQSGKYQSFLVVNKTERANGNQKVYNMVADEGETFLMNGVMVKQK